MSTVNLPSLQGTAINDYSGMDDRAEEIAKIRRRMAELGYNPRSLSMAATGKPDTLRNLFAGKSKNLRGDNLMAVRKVLWPDENESANLSGGSVLPALEAILRTLVLKGMHKKEDFAVVFNDRMRDLRRNNQLAEAQVLDQLLDFLHSIPSGLAPQADHKSPPRPADQSKKN